MPARQLDRIIGVIKAYTHARRPRPVPDRAGRRPDGIGERIRKIGREYGTVTGRPRRVGWFDAVAVRYTAALSRRRRAGGDAARRAERARRSWQSARPTRWTAERIDALPEPTPFLLERCTAGLRNAARLEQDDLTGVRSRRDLPAAARRYVDRIEELLGLPVSHHVGRPGPGADDLCE